MKIIALALTISLGSGAFGQAAGAPANKPDPQLAAAQKKAAADRLARAKLTNQAEQGGVSVRLKDIARFRGIRANQIQGVGLLLGLEGTGDSKKNLQTAKAVANYLKSMGQDVDPLTIDPKNAALVTVMAELPPFATNGQRIDVTVTSIGDAKSLRNGTLLMCELKAMGDSETIYAVAQGPISVGGFSASSGGASETKGFMTVGRIPAGATVERGAPTKLVYDGKVYVELDDSDITTAQRLESKINARNPEFKALAINGGTIEVTLPPNLSPNLAMSMLEDVNVMVDNAALVVFNERTGSIVMGGNVRIMPVAIASGTLSVKVEEEIVFPPAPVVQNGNPPQGQSQATLSTDEETQIAMLPPNTTVADLVKIFTDLKLKARDIINILQLMKQQGALKARLVIQ